MSIQNEEKTQRVQNIHKFLFYENWPNDQASLLTASTNELLHGMMGDWDSDNQKYIGEFRDLCNLEYRQYQNVSDLESLGFNLKRLIFDDKVIERDCCPELKFSNPKSNFEMVQLFKQFCKYSELLFAADLPTLHLVASASSFLGEGELKIRKYADILHSRKIQQREFQEYQKRNKQNLTVTESQ